MGGDAFPNTRRMSRAELMAVFAKVKESLQGRDDVRIGMPLELKDKKDFGDVDLHYTILNHSSEEIMKIREELCEIVCKALEVIDRRGLEVFLTKDRLQVDFEYVSPDSFDFSLMVRSHGDFSWLLGRSLQKVGLKIKEEGLYVRKDSSEPPLHREIFLTSNRGKTAELLRIDESFVDNITEKTSEEVFQAIYESKVFRKNHFAAYEKEDNTQSRRRNSKRPMIGKFGEWLEDKQETEYFHAPEFLKEALKFFEKEGEFEAVVAESKQIEHTKELKKKCSAIINGKRVLSRAPDLAGPIIGAVLAKLRMDHGEDLTDYLKWLQTTPSEQIDAKIDACIAESSHSLS